MINSVSLAGKTINANNFSHLQLNSLLPQSKSLKMDNVDTFTKKAKLEKGPLCGIDCCAI